MEARLSRFIELMGMPTTEMPSKAWDTSRKHSYRLHTCVVYYTFLSYNILQRAFVASARGLHFHAEVPQRRIEVSPPWTLMGEQGFEAVRWPQPTAAARC
jgi:hypothetical protein